MRHFGVRCCQASCFFLPEMLCQATTNVHLQTKLHTTDCIEPNTQELFIPHDQRGGERISVIYLKVRGMGIYFLIFIAINECVF